MDVNGIVAMVTGGASGLGEATVRRLAAEGATVLIVDLNEDRAKALIDELGAKVSFIKTDVTDEDSVAEAVEAAAGLGTLRAAVNCAGVGWASRVIGKDGTPHDLGVFRKVQQINVEGTFNVLRFSASQMSKNEPLADGARGVIVNTASVAAYDGQIGQIAYAASKGAIVAMTLPAARDLSPVGIRVNTIAPGTFETPLMSLLPDPQKQALAANIPFPKRLGNPPEYALLVEHMIRNDYLNGETVRLDGAIRMPPK